MGLIGVLHCGKCHRSDVELDAVKYVPMIKYDWLPGQCLPPEAENDLYCKKTQGSHTCIHYTIAIISFHASLFTF